MRDTMVAEFSLRTRRGLWGLHAVAVLAGVFGVSCAVAAGLNDTGFTTCADASGATVSCTAATAVQGQDARYGRDAAAGTGALTKVGGGANGFDFTKISNSSAANVPGVVLAATAALGTGASDWGCTYDNTTGLMWEVKTTSGLRSLNETYSWYSSNAATNGGGTGTASNGVCITSGRCDTEKFTQDVNALSPGMCGHSDWRMPTSRELLSLVRLDAIPTIDSSYFPNTFVGGFWSSSPVAGRSDKSWFVDFNAGYTVDLLRYGLLQIRLVRVGR